ncbi:hypothetical protein B0T24DRAFT_19420 [Lasiosphaeria ovina]|uniref:Uncharacterized protein n=1 Tax=Lasiosphaeria ovina TaxID=92902 RepID=A0AAE0TWY5_9PEZI|nr:hypothetical protein B0T24DRAFT_19420 [Lasiosphaeria ovina]
MRFAPFCCLPRTGPLSCVTLCACVGPIACRPFVLSLGVGGVSLSLVRLLCFTRREYILLTGCKFGSTITNHLCCRVSPFLFRTNRSVLPSFWSI